MSQYVFDLRKRERGLVVATRYVHHPGPVAAGHWMCSASDDASALESARCAAFADWPVIVGRLPNDFIVRFGDGEPTRDNEAGAPSGGLELALKVPGRMTRRS